MTTQNPALSNTVKTIVRGLSEQPTKEKPVSTVQRPLGIAPGSFRIDPRWPILKKAFDAVLEFQWEINKAQPYWITLCGPSGVGKTMLAKQAQRDFLMRTRFLTKIVRGQLEGNGLIWVSWRELAPLIVNKQFGWLEDICKEHYVIIDDLGTGNDPWKEVAAAADRIFDARLGKWTLITCNLFLDQVAEQMDVRIASRMQRGGNKVIEIDVPDYATRRTA